MRKFDLKNAGVLNESGLTLREVDQVREWTDEQFDMIASMQVGEKLTEFDSNVTVTRVE
jgi:hypothetical protein